MRNFIVAVAGIALTYIGWETMMSSDDMMVIVNTIEYVVNII